jgi:hypothetical protein
VHGGEPPHPVFDLVELVVFGGFHSRSFSTAKIPNLVAAAIRILAS